MFTSRHPCPGRLSDHALKTVPSDAAGMTVPPETEGQTYASGSAYAICKAGYISVNANSRVNHMGISPWEEAKPPGDDAIGGLTLDGLWQGATLLLAEGASTPGSPLRKPVLSTVDTAGEPQARTVILRRFDPEHRRLDIYTDARSAKAAELDGNPAAAFTFYDPRRETQLRLSGRVTLHTDDESAERAWSRLGPRNMADYLARAVPGTPSPSPEAAMADGEGDEARMAAARANFALLAFTYDRLDVLVLGRTTHRRALFRWTNSPAPAPDDAVWLVP